MAEQPDPQTEARLATEAAPAGHLEEDATTYRRNYLAGYRSGQRGTGLDRADADGRTARPGWINGYEDAAAGRPSCPTPAQEPLHSEADPVENPTGESLGSSHGVWTARDEERARRLAAESAPAGHLEEVPPLGEGPDDRRDYAEEAYLRAFCAECDGPCRSDDRHAELDQLTAEQLAPAPPSCNTKTDRGRTAVLRQDARHRHARADAAVRALPPASPPR